MVPGFKGLPIYRMKINLYANNVTKQKDLMQIGKKFIYGTKA